MADNPVSLKLMRGDVVLGTIDVNPGEADYPWYSGKFHPTPAFETVRDLFAEELALLRANSTDDSALWDDWEAVHEDLHAPGVRLEGPDSKFAATELLIHIDGAEAWWRGE